jgi:hypothetical protein
MKTWYDGGEDYCYTIKGGGEKSYVIERNM